MALRFLDSFDHYNTPSQKWTSLFITPVIRAASARTGVNGLFIDAFNEWVAITLDNQTTWIVGFGFRVNQVTGANGARVMGTYDAAVRQGSIRLNPDMTLTLMRGDVAVATSTRALALGTYYYLEFKHIIANAGGTLEVRVNEEVWATFNGDTQATANQQANMVLFGNDPSAAFGLIDFEYDDIYILDGTGAAPNNDYWGDTQVHTLMPDGAGFYTELATLVGAPTHWQAVDEVPPDEDVSYVADNVLDRRDTFTFQNLPIASGTINGIQVLIRAREDAAGAPSIARMYRNAGVDNQGADTVIGAGYAYWVREIMATDPIAAAAWTVASINSAEFGVRIRP